MKAKSGFWRDLKEIQLCYWSCDFHTNDHLWISQILLDSVSGVGAMFKCFHCANSSFDLSLRMKLSISVQRCLTCFSSCRKWITFCSLEFWIIYNVNCVGLLKGVRWMCLTTTVHRVFYLEKKKLTHKS